ncbi:DUF6788 family protein [Cutibacterium acnes]
MNTDKIPLKSLSSEILRLRRNDLLHSFPPFDQLIRGSLITRHVKCGKSNCHCSSGKGHRSLYLSSLQNGKTKLDYVPSTLEPWVRERLENYHRVQKLTAELAEINMELLRRREIDG